MREYTLPRYLSGHFSLQSASTALTCSELAAALADDQDDNADDGGSEDGLSAEEEEEDDDGKSDEEDEETTEKKAKIRQLTSEIKALEGAIDKKKATFTRGNAIMEVSRCFALLQSLLTLETIQRDDQRSQRRYQDED